MNTPLFGAGGVRGIINHELTPEVALQLGRAVGTTFTGRVAIATDARDSARAVSAAIMAGIMSVGTDIVDLGLLPTPALQYYVRTHPWISGGVMITASHNPQCYNGLKLIHKDGRRAGKEDEQALEMDFLRDIPSKPASEVGLRTQETGVIESYVDYIVSHVDAEAIRSAGLTVCVDCANGSASLSTPILLRKLGVRSVTLASDPEGTPMRESDPTRENLRTLIALTPQVGADFGIAHDSDGSRAVFIDDKGRFLNGDESGALVAKRILAEKKGKVVTPVSSSSVLTNLVEENGGLMRYTAIDSYELIRKMIESLAVFGVEENGGMIFPDVHLCRDGAMALAKVLEIVAKEGPLSTLASELPEYHMVRRRVSCPDDLKVKVMDAFVDEINDEGLHYDTTDGIKVSSDSGWVLIRASTTEPYIRVYAESADMATAETNVDYMVDRISMILSDNSA